MTESGESVLVQRAISMPECLSSSLAICQTGEAVHFRLALQHTVGFLKIFGEPNQFVAHGCYSLYERSAWLSERFHQPAR